MSIADWRAGGNRVRSRTPRAVMRGLRRPRGLDQVHRSAARGCGDQRGVGEADRHCRRRESARSSRCSRSWPFSVLEAVTAILRLRHRRARWAAAAGVSCRSRARRDPESGTLLPAPPAFQRCTTGRKATRQPSDGVAVSVGGRPPKSPAQRVNPGAGCVTCTTPIGVMLAARILSVNVTVMRAAFDSTRQWRW